MKKIIALTIVCLMLLIAASVSADPGTLYVDDDGYCDGNSPCYSHPQDAVNDATPGDTILVYPGTYDSRFFDCPWSPNCSCSDQYSPALIVYKDDLTIESVEGPENTTIQATHTCWSNGIAVQNSTEGGLTGISGWAPNAVVIVANNVTIEGFTFHRPFNCSDIYGCFWNTAGVFIGSKGAGYSDFLGYADGATVRNNVFSNVWHAVYIWHSKNNTIVNNTVEALGASTGHWAAISTYDGYNDAQIGFGNLSENNLIAYNTIADKGIALGAWDPATWTSNAGSQVCCNTTTNVGVTYAHGPVTVGCNTGGLWVHNTDNVLRITGITYNGTSDLVPVDPTTHQAAVTLGAAVGYDGSSDGSGIAVTFTVDDLTAEATTTAGGLATAAMNLPPGVYTIQAKVSVCESCEFTDSAMLVIYDSDGGFVTGGGWINSPPGAISIPSNVVLSGPLADTGWGGDYTRDLSLTCDPNNTPITFEGWVELSNLTDNGALLLGLIDKKWVDDGNSGFFSGAYAYLGHRGINLRIGPSDGNAGGGELNQVGANVTFDPWENVRVDFSMEIFNGQITVAYNGNNYVDDYGEVPSELTWGEFEFGAYPGVDLWSPEGSVDYEVTVSGCEVTPVGKATFGFVSKYKKGATVPEGNTEFVFKAASLNFHSSSYDWLVVTGSDYAKFKGAGTINGMGDYKFMIWAGDGEPDTFRIKIWEEDEYGNETVSYDNGFDQEIAGGSIVIHTGKK